MFPWPIQGKTRDEPKPDYTIHALRYRSGISDPAMASAFACHVPHNITRGFADFPAGFAVDETGHRMKTNNGHQMPCHGNPETVTYLIRGYEDFYKGDKTIWAGGGGGTPTDTVLPFSPPDHPVECHCGYCRKLIDYTRPYHAQASQLMGGFVRQLAEAATSKWPDKTVQYAAYYECLEPEPDKLVTLVREHDGPVWEDNDIEIFVNDPILGGNYFQVMINAAGVVCDGSVVPGQKGITASFESNIRVKTSFAEDRWFLEAILPVGPIIGSRLNAGQVLKMNVMRVRKVGDKFSRAEASTWSSGTPHSVETFHPVTFAAPRAIAAGNRTELDTRLWKNGSFNEVEKRAKRIPKHWAVAGGFVPKHWCLSSARQYGGDMEMALHDGSRDNYFVALRRGFIFQSVIPSDKIRVGLRVRGRGKLRFSVMRYQTKGGGFIKSHTVKSLDVNHPEWRHFGFEYVRPSEDKTEMHMLALWPVSEDAEISIDDIFVSGSD